MSTQDRTPVSRRRALQTGGLAAIMAGLLGSTTAPAVAAEPDPRVVVINVADLIADSQAALEEATAARDAAIAADTALLATLSAAQRELWDASRDAHDDMLSADHDLRFREVLRHFPGLAPALSAIWWQHDIGWDDRVGVCCTPEHHETY